MAPLRTQQVNKVSEVSYSVVSDSEETRQMLVFPLHEETLQQGGRNPARPVCGTPVRWGQRAPPGNMGGSREVPGRAF